MEPVGIAFLLYPNLTQLDFAGPAQILSRLGEAPRRKPGPMNTELRGRVGRPIRAASLRLRVSA